MSPEHLTRLIELAELGAESKEWYGNKPDSKDKAALEAAKASLKPKQKCRIDMGVFAPVGIQ